VNKVIDNSGELVFEFFPCCRWNATTAPPPLSVGDEYRTLKYDFSDSFDKLVLEFSNPMQDGSTKAMRTTKIGNGLVVDGDLATSTTMRLMDFQPQYFNGSALFRLSIFLSILILFHQASPAHCRWLLLRRFG
jgi:hypothetical protein